MQPNGVVLPKELKEWSHNPPVPTLFGLTDTRQTLRDSLHAAKWKDLAVRYNETVPMCLVSPLQPEAVWCYPRDEPDFALMRLKQLRSPQGTLFLDIGTPSFSPSHDTLENIVGMGCHLCPT